MSVEDFTYAHRDYQAEGKKTPTAQFNGVVLSEKLANARKLAFEREIPISSDETLCFLLTLLSALKPKRILEIGTATGVSAVAMLEVCADTHLTTIEKNAEFFAEASRNFKDFCVDCRVTQIGGDAGEILESLSGEFDFIFLDSAKVQYVKYLPQLKRLLASGGTLFADDVLLYGYVTGEVPTPPKRKMLVEHIREYLTAVKGDSELTTTVINVGDGVALSVKK